VTACFETTGEQAATLDERVHTNHYLDPYLSAAAPEPSEGSTGRYRKVSAALQESPVATPEDAMRVLREVDYIPGYDLEGDAADEEEAIVFSMVCEVESGRMWTALGDPKETQYELVELPVAA
jgi:hypothetical protein